MLNRNIAPPLSSLFIPGLLPYVRKQLPNGIELVYINDPAQEVFKLDIVFEAGVLYQPQPLVASSTISMLNEGTTLHNSEEIANLFDYYGAYIDFNCGLNKAEISLISLSKYADKTIPMIAEMVIQSIFPEKELEIYLTNKRQEFLVSIEKTSYLAHKKFAALLFGEEHPYANRISEKDYYTVTSALLRNFYEQHITARNCRVIMCGNINEEILKITEECFSRLNAPAQTDENFKHQFMPGAPGRYNVPKDNSVQNSIRIGKKGVRLTDEDYSEFLLLNTILGGYFGSRLMSNIREEKGYTYGIQSFNVSMPQNSYWCISSDVNKENTEAVIEEVLKEIRLLQTQLIPEDELNLVKNYLHGELLREVDGVFSQSDALKHKLNYKLDNRVYIEMIEKIKICTSDRLLELANKHWQENDFYIVTAG